MALGIALVTNSNLGTTPITSLPYALGAIFALSLGTATFLLNLLFVALQKVLLRKEFPRPISCNYRRCCCSACSSTSACG